MEGCSKGCAVRLRQIYDQALVELNDPKNYGHKLELPELDQEVVKESISICGHLKNSPEFDHVILCSQLERAGGHTAIVKRLLKNLEGRKLVVLSDFFGKYKTNPLPDLGVDMFICDVQSFEGRALEIAEWVSKARNTWILSHQHDSIIYGACPPKLSNYYFVHHCDHEPVLGVTVPHFHHVDLVREMPCRGYYLPLGRGDEETIHTNGFNIATCGSWGKYKNEGVLPYRKVVEVCLEYADTFTHIGRVTPNHMESMKGVRGYQQVDYVPSLRDALQDLNVSLYMASFPIAGGNAGVEAQCAGVAVLHPAYKPSPLFNWNVYYTGAPTWYDERSLRAGLRINREEQGKWARQFYETEFSDAAFRDALEELLTLNTSTT